MNLKIEKTKKQVQTQQNNISVVSKKEENEANVVSIFKISDKSKVDSEAQDIADNKLLKIANVTIDKSNKKISTTKRIGILGAATALLGLFAKNLFFKGPKPSSGMIAGVIGLAFVTVVGLIELIGAKTKREAQNTKVAANTKDKSNIDFSFANNSGEDFIEKIGRTLFSTNTKQPMSSQKIKELAPDILGKDKVKSRGIYFVNNGSDDQKACKLMIADARIDSGKYDGVKKDGIDIEYNEIPVEYTKFIDAYLDGENISKEKADKFIEIVKALNTDGVYSKGQAGANHKGIKEDADLFDISGDGELNYGDIAKINLQLKIQDGKINTNILEKLNNCDNWQMATISQLTHWNQDECDIFDLNGDGNIDAKDFGLYNKSVGKTEIMDINNDGKIDKIDANLMKLYLDAILTRYDNMGEFINNTKEIMGGEERQKILQDYFNDNAA